MRVAIYVRVSTKDQDTAIQKAELAEYCRARGWDNTEIFEDKATGTNLDRESFQRLLSLSRSRKIDLIVVWKLDRAFRSLKDLVNILSEFEELGVKFVAVRDNLDLTSGAGKMICHVIGAFAEFEASLIKERVRAGIQRAKQKGIRLGRPSTYTKVDYSKVRRLHAEGVGPSQISRDLKIARATVYRILKAA